MTEENTAGKFEGFRGVISDIGLLVGDLLGLGKPDADEQMMIEVIFGLMGYLAKADRLVTSHESDFANAVMDEGKMSMAKREIAYAAFERGMRRDIHPNAEILRFTDSHPANSKEVERLYDCLLRLAAADGRLDPREYGTMVDITHNLGLAPATLDNKLARFNIKH